MNCSKLVTLVGAIAVTLGIVVTAVAPAPSTASTRTGFLTEDSTKVYPDPKEQPVRLEPQGGPQTYAADRYVIDASPAPWTSSRNGPGQFFQASVPNGAVFDVVQRWGATWYFGTVNHNYQYCGWILAENLDASGAGNSVCPALFCDNRAFDKPNCPPKEFTQYINCETCGGGWATQLQQSVCYYRNVYPWNVPAIPLNGANVCRSPGYTVYWRYVSEDGNWVAISDPAIEHLKWFFVPHSALPGICGSGSNAKAPTDFNKQQDWGLVCKNAAEGG